MRCSFFITLASLALGLFASSALAAPINYDESVEGDIGSVLPFVMFTLDHGVNTISGTIGDADPLEPPPFDFDSFAFTVPAGLQVTAGQLTLSDVAGNIVNSRWVLYRGLGQSMPIQDFPVPSPGSSSFTALPLLPDTYNFSQLQVTGVGMSNYTFSFTVIPEPTTLALAALGSLTLLRRRRA